MMVVKFLINYLSMVYIDFETFDQAPFSLTFWAKLVAFAAMFFVQARHRRLTGLLLVAGLVLAVRVPAQTCFPAPSGIIGWWPGDTGANDIFSTNNGTLVGATAGNPGMVGGCMVFDGTNDYVSIPDSPALHPAELTIEAWIRSDLLNATSNGGYPGQQYIIFHQNDETDNFEGFDLAKDRRPLGDTNAQDTWCFEVTSTAGDNVFLESLVYVQTNVWYHVAGVRGSNYIQLYVNGQLQGQTNVDFPQGYGPYPLYFADTGESYYDPKFAGALDEVTLYNRPLASNEIYSIYAAGREGKCKIPTIVSIGVTNSVSGPPTELPELMIAGITGQSYGIQGTSSLGASNTWAGLTNQTLSSSTNLFIDPAPGTQRYYRLGTN
jgi:hypothetical protein